MVNERHLEVIASRIESGAYLSPYRRHQHSPWRDERRNFIDDQAKKLGWLKQDLYTAHNVKDNPKRELVWAKAWDMGSPAGLGGVVTRFADLAELIR